MMRSNTAPMNTTRVAEPIIMIIVESLRFFSSTLVQASVWKNSCSTGPLPTPGLVDQFITRNFQSLAAVRVAGEKLRAALF
jgi:hypothetical protein